MMNSSFERDVPGIEMFLWRADTGTSRPLLRRYVVSIEHLYTELIGEPSCAKHTTMKTFLLRPSRTDQRLAFPQVHHLPVVSTLASLDLRSSTQTCSAHHPMIHFSHSVLLCRQPCAHRYPLSKACLRGYPERKIGLHLERTSTP